YGRPPFEREAERLRVRGRVGPPASAAAPWLDRGARAARYQRRSLGLVVRTPLPAANEPRQTNKSRALRRAATAKQNPHLSRGSEYPNRDTSTERATAPKRLRLPPILLPVK